MQCTCTNCAKYVNIIFLVMQTSYVCFDPSTLFLLFPDQCVCGRERPRKLTSVQRKNYQHSRRRRSIDSVTSPTEEFFTHLQFGFFYRRLDMSKKLQGVVGRGLGGP